MGLINLLLDFFLKIVEIIILCIFIHFSTIHNGLMVFEKNITPFKVTTVEINTMATLVNIVFLFYSIGFIGIFLGIFIFIISLLFLRFEKIQKMCKFYLNFPLFVPIVFFVYSLLKLILFL